MTLSELTGPGGPFEIAESEGPHGVTATSSGASDLCGKWSSVPPAAAIKSS